MAASEVRVNVKADGAGFNRTMSGLEGRLKTFGSNIKSQLAAAFGAGAIAAFTRSVVQYAGHIKDAAEQMDVNPETAQGLEIIAKNAGAELSHLEGMLAKVEDAKNAALSGDANKKDLFAQLGFSLGDLATKSPVQLLEDIAKAYTKLQNNPEFTTALGDLLGVKSMPKFRGMAEDLGHLQVAIDKLRESGLIIKDEDIRRLDEYGKGWERFLTRMKVYGANAAMVAADTYENNDYGIKSTSKMLEKLPWLKAMLRPGSIGGYLGSKLFSGLKEASPVKPLPNLDKAISTEELIKVPEQLQALGVTATDIKNSKKGVKTWLEAYKTAFNEVAPYGINPKGNTQSVKSDSLLSVGNFLGNRTSSMTTIAQRTNELLSDIRRVLYERLGAKQPATTAPSSGSGFLP